MKKWLVFLLGIIAGIFFSFIVILYLGITSENSDNGMILFEEPAESVSNNDFEVIKVLDEYHALAHEIKWIGQEHHISTNLVVVITNSEGKKYYDNQIIKTPRGKSMRQVGVYQYHSDLGEKTVPIVKLMDTIK